ncbi:MAG TPA: hypothetical protein VGQ99_01335 [Tepidisphaeraceae bacterium]|jgi:hypothetical protein|nr:hypothetical protein [Tepidisphaeraceae bacterium]
MISRIPNLRLPLSLVLLISAAGCSSNGAAVPRDAQLVAERSAALGFSAPEAGTVFITDKKSGKLVYSTPVRYADKLIFLPENKRVLLNGNVVKEDTSFDAKQIHRLYFLKG